MSDFDYPPGPSAHHHNQYDTHHQFHNNTLPSHHQQHISHPPSNDGGDQDGLDQDGDVKPAASGKEKSGGASEFVKKLYRMLEDGTFSEIVSWGYTGDSFVVKDMNSFTRSILPLHFKHSNFASFVRQLNKYDFHKVKNPEEGGSPYGEHTWEFKHPNFRSDMKDSLEHIKRKAPAPRKQATPAPSSSSARPGNRASAGPSNLSMSIDPSLPSQNPSAPSHSSIHDLQAQIDQLVRTQQGMQQHMGNISQDYQVVMGEMMNFQRNLVAQDQLMQNLIQYLVNLEADQKAAINPSTSTPTSAQDNFTPSSQAQKLISSYTEVARQSYDQMADMSRRASISGRGSLPPPPPGFASGPQSSSATPSASSTDAAPRPAYVPGWAVPPRVLLVEDDAVCRKLSSKFLQVFGCQIDVAEDGVSAVNKMNSAVEKYDLVLMDIVMPNLDGVSATSLIRQFDPMTPIISMTSNSGPNDIMTYFSHGKLLCRPLRLLLRMNDILPKPFTKEGLLGMLEKHLIHLKVMQQLSEIPRALGFTDNQIQDALAVSATDQGNVMNPFSAMGISDQDYLGLLQGIALEKEGKRGLEVVQGNEREGKRARFLLGDE